MVDLYQCVIFFIRSYCLIGISPYRVYNENGFPKFKISIIFSFYSIIMLIINILIIYKKCHLVFTRSSIEKEMFPVVVSIVSHYVSNFLILCYLLLFQKQMKLLIYDIQKLFSNEKLHISTKGYDILKYQTLLVYIYSILTTTFIYFQNYFHGYELINAFLSYIIFYYNTFFYSNMILLFGVCFQNINQNLIEMRKLMEQKKQPFKISYHFSFINFITKQQQIYFDLIDLISYFEKYFSFTILLMFLESFFELLFLSYRIILLILSYITHNLYLYTAYFTGFLLILRVLYICSCCSWSCSQVNFKF